jgi:hypothetical protein
MNDIYYFLFGKARKILKALDFFNFSGVCHSREILQQEGGLYASLNTRRLHPQRFLAALDRRAETTSESV